MIRHSPNFLPPPPEVEENLINIRIDAQEFVSILHVYIQNTTATKYLGLRRKTAKWSSIFWLFHMERWIFTTQEKKERKKKEHFLGGSERTFPACTTPWYSRGHSSIINRKYDSIAKSRRNSCKKEGNRVEPADSGRWNLSSKRRVLGSENFHEINLLRGCACCIEEQKMKNR